MELSIDANNISFLTTVISQFFINQLRKGRGDGAGSWPAIDNLVYSF